MRRELLAVLAAGALVLSGQAAEETISDREVWNEGVTLYEQGNLTNAVKVLEPLMNSLHWSARNNPDQREFCARVAELVAKIRHEAGEREAAATAARIALWARPGDARTGRNYTRATDGVKDAREQKRIADILQKAQGQDPGAMMLAATKDARAVMTEAGTYRTNAAERAIALADTLSVRAERLADAWYPLRQAIAQSVTNQEQAATILEQLQQAQMHTRKAAKELGDLSADAYGTMAGVEQDFTRFLKLAILPPAAIGEDLVSQSNAWQDVENFNNRRWQNEALDYTRAFRAKFPAWARAYEQQAQSDTNKPPFKKEDQAKVSALATELEKLQLECSEKDLPPKQEEALGLIRQISDLLPKDKNSGGQGQQQQNPQQNPQQNKDDQNKDDQNKDQSDQKQDQDPAEQPPEPKDEEKDKDASEQEEQKDEELEATLKKAQERNDEHEAQKKARMRKVPLPPNERDW